jgi:hypothetical protein
VRITCSIHAFNLIAFVAVLASIVVLSLAGKATDLAIMTGLVGVLGSFKPWGVQAPPEGPIEAKVINPPSDPANVTETKP